MPIIRQNASPAVSSEEFHVHGRRGSFRGSVANEASDHSPAEQLQWIVQGSKEWPRWLGSLGHAVKCVKAKHSPPWVRQHPLPRDGTQNLRGNWVKKPSWGLAFRSCRGRQLRNVESCGNVRAPSSQTQMFDDGDEDNKVRDACLANSAREPKKKREYGKSHPRVLVQSCNKSGWRSQRTTRRISDMPCPVIM